MADISNLVGDWSISSIKGGVMDIAVYVIWGLVILGVVIFAWKKYQDKKIYMYPVRIFRQRRNGMVKEQNTFGGYIKKGKITQFIIKIGKFKKKAMDRIPLSEHMDEDNRVYYWQLSPESPLVQVRRKFEVEPIWVPNENFIEPTNEQIEYEVNNEYERIKDSEDFKEVKEEKLKNIARSKILQGIEIERNKLIEITTPTYMPIHTDLKQQAMMDIASYKQVLGVDVNKQFAYFIAGVIALIILGIIIFYIAVNKGDVPILTQLLPLAFLRKKRIIK